MSVIFALWGLSVAFEVAQHHLRFGTRAWLILAVGLQAFLAGYLLAFELSGYAILFALVSAYRIFNSFRTLQAQMHEHYLRRVTRSTFWVLTCAQVIIADLWVFSTLADFSASAVWLVAVVVQLLVAATALASILRTLRRTAWPTTTVHFSDKELPTITVAIPARNETDDLHACLQSILASDYPKLEVLVLDDCSQLKRTPEIIRGFAHAGARFIQGTEPGKTWLAKNWAYEQLVKASSGEYILFCGVDARFSPQSLRQMVTVMLERKKTLVSILPERSAEAYGTVSLIQQMRYYWELVPPRRLFNRPPVLSTCWMIESDTLRRDGGFKAVSRAIVPEAYFAAKATVRDGYSFLRSNTMLGIRSTKRILDQRDTAIRMRYPQLHRRPEQVCFIALLELTLLILPYGVAIAGFWLPLDPAIHILSIITVVLLSATHMLVAATTKVNSLWFACIAAPVTFLVDVLYLHISMWKYEFSTVDWKGRNICIPVMHVVPHLPPLPDRASKH